MPKIDVRGPAAILPGDCDEGFACELTRGTAGRGHTRLGLLYLDNTAAFIHRLPDTVVSTAAASSARPVHVQIVSSPGSPDGEGQRRIVAEATETVARITDCKSLASRISVILPKAADGGRGLIRAASAPAERAAQAR